MVAAITSYPIGRPHCREQLMFRDEALEAHWKKFGTHLNGLITQADTSVTDFARASDTSLTHVSRLLNGASGTRRGTLPRFIRALQMAGLRWTPAMVTELYEMAGFVPPPTESIYKEILASQAEALREGGAQYEDGNIPEIIAMYQGLTPEGQEDLLEYAKMLQDRLKRRQHIHGRKADDSTN